MRIFTTLIAIALAAPVTAQTLEEVFYLQLKLQKEGLHPEKPSGLVREPLLEAISAAASRNGTEPTFDAVSAYYLRAAMEARTSINEEDKLAAIQDAIKSRLKDPDSARFRDVYIFDGTDFVCGEVNAKNSMGGYTGFTTFMASLIVEGEVIIALPVFIDSPSERNAFHHCAYKIR